MIKHLLWALPLLGCQAEVLTCYQRTDCPSGQQCTTAGECVTLRPSLDQSVNDAEAGPDASPPDLGPPDLGQSDTGQPDVGELDRGQADSAPADLGPDAQAVDAGPVAPPLNCVISNCVPIDDIDNRVCDRPNDQDNVPHALATTNRNATIARAWFDDQNRLHTACVSVDFPRENRSPTCSGAQDYSPNRVQVRLIPNGTGWWLAWAHRTSVQIADLTTACELRAPAILAQAVADDFNVARAPDGETAYTWAQLNPDGQSALHMTIGPDTISWLAGRPGYGIQSPVLAPPLIDDGRFWLLYTERILIDEQSDEQRVFAQAMVRDADGLHRGPRYNLNAGQRSAAVRNHRNTLIAIVSDNGNEEGDATLRVLTLNDAGAPLLEYELGPIADGQTPTLVQHPSLSEAMISWTDPNNTPHLARFDDTGLRIGEGEFSACGDYGTLGHPTVTTTPTGYLLQYHSSTEGRLVVAETACQ